MTRRKRAGLMLALAVTLAGALALPARSAYAHGRRGGGRGVVYVRGFYRPAWGWGYGPGWGFAPYYGWGFGPYPYYLPAGGVDMNVAMMSGYGAVDLSAKPNRAEVWVDGKYVGEARDLDGYPSFLWLPEGGHRLAVYKGGYKTFEEEIAVRRGMRTEIKVRLEPGDSPPPGPKPADKHAAEKGEK